MRQIQQFTSPIRGVDGRYGYFLYNQFDSYIGRSLELYGEYCENEIHLFKRLVKPTDTIWEIGANIGSQTIPLCQIASNGTVYAFEPQIEVFKLLCANLSINVCERAIPHWLAIGDFDGELNLPTVNYHQTFNFGAVSLVKFENTSEQIVNVRMIDNLKNLKPPNFIKIDVEGMELSVLRGGQHIIEAMRPILYVENNGNHRFGEGTSESLIQFLWDMNYRLYWHGSYYYNVNNYFHNSDNVFGRQISRNMVCVPKESSLEINENLITQKSAT